VFTLFITHVVIASHKQKGDTQMSNQQKETIYMVLTLTLAALIGALVIL